MIKPEARILDATAGNRCLWKTRKSEFVVWIDIEEDLHAIPDRFLDCTKTDYIDGYFWGIIYDPPHDFGRKKNAGIFTTPSKTVADMKWPKHKRTNPRYYGADKFRSREELIHFIEGSEKEFYRILNDGGILWFKWSEIRIKLKRVLEIFDDRWKVMIKIPQGSHHKSIHQTYWIMLMKKTVFDVLTYQVRTSKVFEIGNLRTSIEDGILELTIREDGN